MFLIYFNIFSLINFNAAKVSTQQGIVQKNKGSFQSNKASFWEKKGRYRSNKEWF